jgi:hypothetical protein
MAGPKRVHSQTTTRVFTPGRPGTALRAGSGRAAGEAPRLGTGLGAPTTKRLWMILTNSFTPRIETKKADGEDKTMCRLYVPYYRRTATDLRLMGVGVLGTRQAPVQSGLLLADVLG